MRTQRRSMATSSGAKASLRRRARRTHERAVAEMKRNLTRDANRDTGAMANSVTTSPTAGLDRLVARVTVPDTGTPRQSDKARWTDAGTAAHIIRPRRARALRFQSGNRVVFARVVHHPGYRGSQWWSKNIRQWSARVQSAWRSSR